MKKVRQGIVFSHKMDKTAIVIVERTIRDPLYKKVMKRQQKFKVHDPENLTAVGDRVKIIETRPISKDKHFRLLEIVSKGKIIEKVELAKEIREALGEKEKVAINMDKDLNDTTEK